MNGLLLIDKPAGPTSHDVVAAARRLFGQKKAGHAGTLDPQATGLLVLALGEATRWLPYLPSDKRYLAGVTFGLETETQDIWGRELSRSGGIPTAAQIRGALEGLRDQTSQVPPMVSALKHQGRPLYEYARQGIEIARPARPMEIFSLKVLKVEPPFAEFELHCGSGTYVRSLCALAGAGLGGACMSSLRRLSVGPFSLEQATPLKDMGKAPLLGPQAALGHLKELKLGPEGEADLAHGRPVELPEGAYDEKESWRLSGAGGELLGLGSPRRSGDGWRMQPERVFHRT